MCLKGTKQLTEDQLDLIDKDFLLSLVNNDSLVVSNEYDFYDFLKQWTLRDMERNDEQVMETNDESSRNINKKYHELFSHIRLKCLLSYPDKVAELFQDRLFSGQCLSKELYELHLRMLNIETSLPLDEEVVFRFARKIPASHDVYITTDFFYAGVVLKYKFNTKRIAIERLGPSSISNKSSLTNYGPVAVRTKVILYGPSNNCRCNSETTATCVIDLNIGKERMIHNWGKAVTFPSILFAELQISCGNQTVEIS